MRHYLCIGSKQNESIVYNSIKNVKYLGINIRKYTEDLHKKTSNIIEKSKRRPK